MKKQMVLILLCGAALGQNPSPQPNFATQLLAASPSLYLNFDDFTTAFKDQVSGLTFGGTGSAISSTGAIPTSTSVYGPGQVMVSGAALPAGSLTSFQVQYLAAPTAGWPLTCGVFTLGASNVLTATASVTVTVGATTALQSFTAPTNFTAFNVAAGQLFGCWTPAAYSEPYNGSSSLGAYYLNSQTSFPSGANTYSHGTASGYAIIAGVTTTFASGAVTVRQAGFDSTQVNNTSAAFAYNAFNAAPNGTLGTLAWNSPWTMLVHIDRLAWDRTGTLVLASKGDSATNTTSWWKLTLSMNGNYSKVCFTQNGYGAIATSGGGGGVQNGICTNSYFDAVPNGFNYDIVVTDNGTGASGVGTYSPGQQALQLYVNGLNQTYIPETSFSNSYSIGFGYATVTVSGGTGYAASTPFMSSGGGANCVVAGTMLATGGIPSPAINLTVDYGCTSAPTIVLTAPTGTGASLMVGLGGATLNSSAWPLMVPGAVTGATFTGVDAADSAQSLTYIDKFAILPGVLSQTQVQSLFYQTKFYQRVLKTLPSTPYTLVFDNDGCADSDNIFALALTIAAQKIGYIRLAGVVDTVGDGLSEAMYRQMLDQAGLAHIPVAVPSTFGSSSAICLAANVNTFNATTSQVSASYMQAKTLYRQVFASNPTSPVFIMLGGSFRGVSDMMQSPADGISSLTGAQLVARNATNGGAIYAQGLGANATFTADNTLEDWTAGQYVVGNNGLLPIYWYGGSPQVTGPGVLSTRTSKDPFYLAATTWGDTRQGYDSLPTQSFLSTLFAGGVTVTISGSGTGYAAQTAFTSTGGGSNCVVTGYMLSTSGVPSSIISTSGVSGAGLTFAGIGTGCLTAASPPTIVLTAPTGTGTVLSASTTASPCGTVTITSATSGSTSTATCSNHYFLPYSLNAAQSPQQGAVMEWFINSLVNPSPGGAPRAR